MFIVVLMSACRMSFCWTAIGVPAASSHETVGVPHAGVYPACQRPLLWLPARNSVQPGHSTKVVAPKFDRTCEHPITFSRKMCCCSPSLQKRKHLPVNCHLAPRIDGPVNGGSIAFDHTCRFLYVANSGNNSITVYAFDASTGLLNAISGATYPTAQVPVSIVVAQP